MRPERPEAPGYRVPVARAERFIATARIVLASGSLIAISLDPSSPARYATFVNALLSLYVLHATALLIAMVRWTTVPRPWPVIVHAIDLASFGCLMHLTQGPTSPFFVFFIFALVASTIRWHSRGAIWTAVVSLAIFGSLGAYSGLRDEPGFEMNRFIIRGLYLGVGATLLGYLGRYHERLGAELARIAAWDWRASAERHEVAANVLEHVAGILQVSRVLLIFEDQEEPWVNVVVRSASGQIEWERHAPDLVEQLEGGELAGRSAIARKTDGPDGPVLVLETSEAAQPLDRRIAALLGERPVVTCPMVGDGWRGRLFALDCRDPTIDDVRLTEVIGALAAARLDQMFLLRRLRDAAVGDARMRFARDLHDGLLQSLGGAALQLRVVDRLLEVDRREARARLREVETILVAEQRELRRFIAELKPQSQSTDQGLSLAEQLHQLADRVRRQWGVAVELTLGDLQGVPRALEGEAYRLAHEALANSARHAGATIIRARLAVQSDTLTIDIEDDGRGFPFQGTYDLATLIRLRTGPATLKDRVTALGGQLSISSSGTGAQVSIHLPLSPRSAGVRHRTS